MDDSVVPAGSDPLSGAAPPTLPPQPSPFHAEESTPATSHSSATEAAAASADALGSALDFLQDMVSEGFAAVLGEFRDKIVLDRFKEEQVTRLHEELQSYKNDFLSRPVRQILLGVIRLHDDLGKVAASLRRGPAEEVTQERLVQQLEGFQDDVELLLGQHGVLRFEAPGESFDPRQQTALRTVPAADSARVGRIAERLRPGFEQGETLLQKERVAVYAEAKA